MQFIYVIVYSMTHALTLILLSSPVSLPTWGTVEATVGGIFDHLTSLLFLKYIPFAIINFS